jgi:hypothetical protein
MSGPEVSNDFRTSYVQSDALGQPNACYATLGGYNSRVPGTINGSPAVVQVPSQRVQQIPVWGSQGYDALTHGGIPYRCGGYYTIQGAYPMYNKACGQLATRACAGTKLHMN